MKTMLFRQRSSRFAYGLLLLAAGLISCTTPTPTTAPFPTNTHIPTATSTPSPTLTPSLTPSPIPGVDWIGQWKIYINGNQTEWLGDAEDGSLYYEFTGSLDSAYLIATGTWKLITKNAGAGPFNWKMSSENPDQFSGNLEEGKFQFCGWREGENRPSPCEWP